MGYFAFDDLARQRLRDMILPDNLSEGLRPILAI